MIGFIVVGLALLLAAQISQWASSWAGRALSERIESTLLAFFDSGASEERRSFFILDADGRPDSAMLDSFVTEAIRRYGEPKRVSIVTISPSSRELELLAAATVRFEGIDVLTTARLRIVPGSANEVALLGVELLDRDVGDLAVGDLGGETRAAMSAIEAPARALK